MVEEKKSKKERLSIYLARDVVRDDGDVIKIEDAKPAVVFDLEETSVALYVKRDDQKPSPAWTKLFSGQPEVPDDLFGGTKSVGAVAKFSRDGRIYLLTFGTGHHLLKTEFVERDFGLRVTLSSVDPDKLRSVDKASYDDNPLNSRTQSTTEVDIFELQMDSELEMLYAVTGVSKIREFGSHVTGRDALTISVETNLRSIPAILDVAYAQYAKDLPLEFQWVDNIRRVKDTEIVEILDSHLDDELRNPMNAIFWLGEPEIVDWEGQIGYSFDLYQNTPRHLVLRLDELLSYLRDNSKDISVESFKAQQIHINSSDYRSIKSWSAYRCLYVEMKIGDERYLLRNGLWFQAEKAFVEMIDSYVSGIDVYDFKFPDYSFDREEQYNESLAATDPDFCLLDKKLTQIGGRYDKIEFCDLVRGKRDLIHVKYYRSSGTLSHLFAQGFVAAEAFVRDESFRSALNGKLPDAIKLDDPLPRPPASEYKVVYAIATVKTLPEDLPFFSKVTLRNAAQTLRALGYGVHLAAIGVDPMILAKKAYKPKKSPR